jgi:site-specific DNA-cytosine methylase
MRVLSVFDGISCAKVALDRAGIPITEYLASEVDKHAIAISTKNHPDITRLGDVREVFMSHLKAPIDLMIGGSPCQDLSIAKKNRQGLAGDRSGLFWEYVRIKNYIRPRWFILENVASMPAADRDTISQALGVNPVMIDASLVSAQSRKRLFWTNIPFTMPEDRGILLKDILQPDAEVDPSFTVNGKSFCLTSSYSKTGTGEAETEHNKQRKQRTMVKVGHIGETDGQANRVYSPDGKSVTLSANGGGSGAKTGLYLTDRHMANLRGHDEKAHCLTSTNYKGSQANGTTLVAVGAAVRGNIRTETPDGVTYSDTLNLRSDEKANALTPTFSNKLSLVAVQGVGKPVVLGDAPLQVLKEGRTELGKQSRKEIRKETGKDSTSRGAGHKAYFGREGTKANCLTTSLGAENLIVKEAVIRKLTPIECERLQGLPDDYTDGVAKTHRYKALGNAFNVDVIVSILRGIQSTPSPQGP